MLKSVTIKDIARKLGLSATTVSRALRGMSDISPQTRELVLKTAQELDYQPNIIAQSLVRNQTRTVGVVIPSFTIPFYASAISGIQHAASEAGYNVLISQSEESYAMEISNIKLLLNSRVDGLIIALSRETQDFGHLSRLLERKVPMVLFNRVSDELPVAKVVVDDYEGAYEVVKHLLEQGCRRIAHIAGPESLQLVQKRLRGYRKALLDWGLTADDALIRYGDLTIENGAVLTQELLDIPEPPDAVFAVCDSAAFGAMVTIKRNGLCVPGDIAVAGFTDEPVAAIVEPALTTVAQPIFTIGTEAFGLLLPQIEKGNEGNFQTKVLPTRLVVRNSSLKSVAQLVVGKKS